MGLNTIILFIVFITLVSCRLLREESSILSFSRTKQEWTIDLMGLFIQGVVIPIFPLLLIPFLEYFFPHYNKRIEINPWNQVLLSFVLIDYLYYWNHRLFHTKRYWHIHRLHHSSKHLDVFATSRNSVITSFVFVYLRTKTLALYLLSDSTYFLFGFVIPTNFTDLFYFCILAFLIGYILDILIYKFKIFGDRLNDYYKTLGAGLWGGLAFVFSIVISYFIQKYIYLLC